MLKKNGVSVLVKKHKPNKCETSFNQHSIKCVLCGEKHVAWSFECPKHTKKNYGQQCENGGAVHNQNYPFEAPAEFKNNGKCLFNMQQHN